MSSNYDNRTECAVMMLTGQGVQ